MDRGCLRQSVCERRERERESERGSVNSEEDRRTTSVVMRANVRQAAPSLERRDCTHALRRSTRRATNKDCNPIKSLQQRKAAYALVPSTQCGKLWQATCHLLQRLASRRLITHHTCTRICTQTDARCLSLSPSASLSPTTVLCLLSQDGRSVDAQFTAAHAVKNL